MSLFSLSKAGPRGPSSAALAAFKEDDKPLMSGPPGAQKKPETPAPPPPAEDAEIDPFEAFMAEINAVTQQQEAAAGKPSAAGELDAKPEPLNEYDQAEGFDPTKDSVSDKYMYRDTASGYDSDKEVYAAAKAADDGVYDDDGNLLPEGASTGLEPLPAVDHAAAKYPPFRRNFYEEHSETRAWSDVDVAAFRKELGIVASGHDVLKPVKSFMHAGFDAKLIHAIAKAEFEAPTAVQSQALPCALSGRDIIAIAQTGSGKTMAFTWPMIVHMMDQPELDVGDGPIGLILAPTRELVVQIHSEAKRFMKPYHINVVALHGGVSKWEQQKALKAGCEVVVATPGRLIDILHTKATNLRRVTYLVLDEADRMLDMGFEKQVRTILDTVRPDRQTLLFSATFKKRVEGLARDAVKNPIRITVGLVGQSNENISQKIVLLDDASKKWPWLVAHAASFAATGKLLVFVSNRAGCEELSTNLGKLLGSGNVASVHGDKSQEGRDDVIRKDVRTVVNFDKARNMDVHVHRIGRTGRMGVDGVQPGTAYTLVTKEEGAFAADLVHNLRRSKQEVSPELLELARTSPRFREGSGYPTEEAPAIDAPPPGVKTWGSMLSTPVSLRGPMSATLAAVLPKTGPGGQMPGGGRGRGRGNTGLGFGAAHDPMASLHSNSSWTQPKPGLSGFVAKSSDTPKAPIFTPAPVPAPAPVAAAAPASASGVVPGASAAAPQASGDSTRKRKSRWGDPEAEGSEGTATAPAAPPQAPAPAPFVPALGGFNPNILRRVRY